ncbi:hypothetical protein Agub_g1963, partial [Astrephomene gubernaculifera]
QSRLHPEQPVSSLDSAALAALYDSIRSVVRQAVEAEADADRFPKDWLFHHRWTNKRASKSADGHPIEFVTVGSRTSAFVPALQKLKGGTAAAATAGGDAAEGDASGTGHKRGRGATRKGKAAEAKGDEEAGGQKGAETVAGTYSKRSRRQAGGKKVADTAVGKKRGASSRKRQGEEEE